MNAGGTASVDAAGSAVQQPSTKPSKKPRYSKFTQQELPACKPLLTPVWVIFTFFIVGVVFIPIGSAALAASRSVKEVSVRYDSICEPGFKAGSSNKCSITLQITDDMSSPVYVYYELHNFYQNHRRYVKSRSDDQLRGGSPSSLSTCSPQDYLGGNESLPINPCGLIAWSTFNDTYVFTNNSSGKSIPVSDQGIAWPSDVNDKFGAYTPTNFNNAPPLRGGANITTKYVNQDERFIVWMRTAALPTFRKLWGIIQTDLPSGTTINVTVTNQYNTYEFKGAKTLVLSTTSWLGGKNDFLGIAYLTVGCLSMVLCIVFLLVHLQHPRKLGDTSYLSWNRKAQHLPPTTS